MLSSSDTEDGSLPEMSTRKWDPPVSLGPSPGLIYTEGIT